MQIMNREIMESVPALQELQGMDIPAAISFRVSKAMMTVEPLVKTIGTVRDSLLQKYSQKDEEGNQVTSGEGQEMTIALEDPEGFHKELDTLLDAGNEVMIETIKVEDLGDVPVKPMVFIGAKWLFEG